MKVYIVVGRMLYEDDRVLAVYDHEEDVIAEVCRIEENICNLPYSSADYEEWEVE